ncbi:MAG: hypothetical protein JNM97_23480 [Rhodoferax sp.]|nr:hypothetical protein [Rhodoferax sp.]
MPTPNHGLRLALAGAFVAASVSAFAGEEVGQVTNLSVRASDGLVYFWLGGGSATGRPACATNPYWVIKSETSSAGKQQLAMLLTAKATGKRVRVSGSDTCLRWSDGEDVNAVFLID